MQRKTNRALVAVFGLFIFLLPGMQGAFGAEPGNGTAENTQPPIQIVNKNFHESRQEKPGKGEGTRNRNLSE